MQLQEETRSACVHQTGMTNGPIHEGVAWESGETVERLDGSEAAALIWGQCANAWANQSQMSKFSVR
jgi:hypothetical protein